MPALVAAILGKSKLWPTPLVSDAEFAATAEVKRARACASTHFRDPLMTGIQTNGIVTAACQASVTGELFLGFASGRVLSFRAERDRVVTVAENIHPVVGLAIDPDGATLVALCQSARTGVVSCFGKPPKVGFAVVPTSFFREAPISGSPRSCPGARNNWSAWERAENCGSSMGHRVWSGKKCPSPTRPKRHRSPESCC